MSENQGPLRIGTMVDERHRVDGVLGQGGFATVYRGVDTLSGRAVAIKVLNAARQGSILERRRFEREVHAVGRLRSPHTVKMYANGETADGAQYIVFEFVAGTDLAEVLKSGTSLEVGVVEHVLRQVLESLREAHQAGVLHRDIKPANILVFRQLHDEWAVKVLDFGVARLMDPDNANLTKTGEFIGTPRYMSPEQLLSQPLGPQSDIYSAGMLAVEMLMGTSSMHGTGLSDQLERLQDGHLFTVSGEHSRLHDVISRMTNRDPNARFSSVEAVLNALDAPDLASTTGSRPSMATTHVPEPPPPAASTKTLGVIAVVLVSLVLAVVALVFTQSEEPPPPPPPRTGGNGASLIASNPDRTPEPTTSVIADVPDVADADATRPDLGDPSIPRSPGCGEKPGWRGTRTFAPGGLDVVSEQDERNVYIRLPSDYARHRPHAVLLLFQTALVSAKDFANALGAPRLADRENLIVILIEENESFHEYDRDSKLVVQAVDWVSDHACVDRSKIFAIGHGLGSGITRTLPCTLRLAGIATIGGWVEDATPACLKSVPFTRFVGTEDKEALIAGGANCNHFQGDHVVQSLAAIEKRWRKRNDCRTSTTEWQNQSGCRTWSCRSAPFVSCTVPGGQHLRGAMPKTMPFLPGVWPGCEAPPFSIAPLEPIWAFFDSLPT